MFSLFKHIDIDCVYQLKTSSIFLPVLHVYLLAFLRCLYQSQIITLKQELVPLSIFKICIRYVFSEWILQFKTFPGVEHIFYNPHLKKIQNIQQTDSSSSPVLIWMFSRNHLLLQSSHLTAFRHLKNLSLYLSKKCPVKIRTTSFVTAPTNNCPLYLNNIVNVGFKIPTSFFDSA